MTDRDDFRGGYPRGAILYGMPPDQSGIQKARASMQEIVDSMQKPGPTTADKTIEDLKARLDWLENQLKMTQAWTYERDMIKRMIVAALVPSPSVTEEPKR